MPKSSEYLCSDLLRLRLSTGEVLIGNLEEISKVGCVVALDQAVPPESTVRLECVDCPKGQPSCFDCRLAGRVMAQSRVPKIGLLTTIRFVHGGWCDQRWRPRYLLALDAITGVLKGARAGGAEN